VDPLENAWPMLICRASAPSVATDTEARIASAADQRSGRHRPQLSNP